MGKPQKTTEQFIREAVEIHGNCYDYSKVKYVNTYTKVQVICKDHGTFDAIPNNHISKSARCPDCAIIRRSKLKIQKAKEKFKNRASVIHNDYYDYSKSEYINSRSKIVITCPVHGDFTQNANSHLLGNGCAKCGFTRTADSIASTTGEFIKKARLVHGDSYDYSNVSYNRSNLKVSIICRKHGKFLQSPNNHLTGYGCSKCGDIKKARKPNIYRWRGWEKAGKKSKNFCGYKLYQLCCYNEQEKFFKIGKTFLTVERRFRNFPYTYEIVSLYEGSAYEIQLMEAKIKRITEIYKPKIYFPGVNECYRFKVNINKCIPDDFSLLNIHK